MPDVHTRHCCIVHGCKYDDDDCTVVTGKETQEYLCECCSDDHDQAKDNLEFLLQHCKNLEELGELDDNWKHLYQSLLVYKLKGSIK
jgi:hypothetical protein